MVESPGDLHEELERLRRERDLYRGISDLSRRDDLQPFLEDALDLVVRIAGARRGYIELFDVRDDDAPRFHFAKGIFDEQVEEIRAAFSRGIIGEALATGRTVALEDAQRSVYGARKSVQRNRTEAVLCAPIGASPPIGVVYLQDREKGGPFSEDDRRIVEDLARALTAPASRLIANEHRFDEADPTAGFRAKLHDGARTIVGRSRALARALERVPAAAKRNIGVLLGGETGTGKSELARLIHLSSPRREGRFVQVNCSDLTPDKLPMMLFGVEKRTFTEVDEQIGRIELAEGGTLFFDEIGDLPLDSQVKLNTFLDTFEYVRLGSTKARRADVRIICATHRDLQEMIHKKEFRLDLYFRLCAYLIRLPSLDERKEDVPLIAEALLDRFAAEDGARRPGFSDEAVLALRSHAWRGNIRELFQRVRSAFIEVDELDDPTALIEPRHLFPDPETSSLAFDGLGMQEATRRARKLQIEKALRETGGNKKKAAKLLGIARSNLYRLMEELQIDGKSD